MDKRHSLFLLAFIIIAFMMIPIYSVAATYTARNIISLDDGWTITRGDSVARDVSLQNLKSVDIPPVRIGDVIIVENTVPENLPETSPTMQIATRNSGVEVFIDGKLIFEHDMENVQRGRFVQSGAHCVSLPSYAAGKRLIIKYSVAADNAFSGLTSPLFGTDAEIAQAHSANTLLMCICSILVGLFGLAMLNLTFVFRRSAPHVGRSLAASAVAVAISGWMICRFALAPIIPFGSHTSMTSYFFQFSIPFFTVLYMYGLRKPYGKTPWTYHTALGVSLIALLALSICLVASASITFIDALFLVDVIVVTGLVASSFRRRRGEFSAGHSYALQYSGLVILMASVILNTVFSLSIDYTGQVRNMFAQNVLSVGSVFYVETQLLNYYVFSSASPKSRDRDAELVQKAYIDHLTSIPNRAYFTQEIENLKATCNDYAIAMFDLNELKTVNDTMGHDAGDHLIVQLARILKTVFANECKMARIGGDEFALIFPSTAFEDLDDGFKVVHRQMEELNRLEPEILHSAAHGLAFAHELPDDERSPYAVLSLADKRMYDMKRKQHDELGLLLHDEG